MRVYKVLIPLDGSDFSRQILPHVCSLLNPSNTELILFHVAAPPEGLVGAPARLASAELPLPMYESKRDAELAKHPIYASQDWESFLATLEKELWDDVQALQDAGYIVSMAVRTGDPAQEIVEFVAEEDVDLVAMTTHGRTGLGRLIFGSVAERVLRQVSIPVMLLRPFEQPAGMRTPGEVLAERLASGQPVRLAVATDGSPFAQTATTFAGDLARVLRAEVTLLIATHQDEGPARVREIREEAQTLLGDLEPSPTSITLTGYPDETIVQHLRKTPADLLVIGAFGDRGTTRFLIGPTAQRLVQHAPTSVWVVKGDQPAFGKILACTAVGDEIVVDVAAQLASALGAKLQLLHAVPPSAAMYLTLPDVINIPPDEVMQQDTPLAQYLRTCVSKLEALGLDGDVVKIRRGPAPDIIFQEARVGNFDLIVVGSQTGPVQDRYFIGSIADRVVKHAHRSVLVVRTTRP